MRVQQSTKSKGTLWSALQFCQGSFPSFCPRNTVRVQVWKGKRESSVYWISDLLFHTMYYWLSHWWSLGREGGSEWGKRKRRRRLSRARKTFQDCSSSPSPPPRVMMMTTMLLPLQFVLWWPSSSSSSSSRVNKPTCVLHFVFGVRPCCHLEYTATPGRGETSSHPISHKEALHGRINSQLWSRFLSLALRGILSR